MPYKAIIFDLYGTLVENFSSHAYDQVQEQMAKTLDIPYPKFRQVMLETINDKSSGGYYAVEDNILEICRRLSVKVNTTQFVLTGGPNHGSLFFGSKPDFQRVLAFTQLNHEELYPRKRCPENPDREV